MKTITLITIGLLVHISVFSQSNTKPNVVLINMDNFGYGELGCYGGGIMRGADTHAGDGIKRISREIREW